MDFLQQIEYIARKLREADIDDCGTADDIKDQIQIAWEAMIRADEKYELDKQLAELFNN